MRRALLALLIVVACRREPAPQPVPAVVLTTPTESALAHRLVELFEREYSRRLSVVVMMPGQILTSSNAAVIYSDPDLDRKLTHTRLHSVFAYEDFYILGPSNDPARVRESPDAYEAVRRIEKHRRRFCSPTDFETPAIGTGVPCHGTAADVVATAAKLGAYTIVDRASAETRLPRRFTILLRDKPPLHKTYIVALLQSPVPNRDAEWFVEWLMSDRGRDAVETMKNPKLYLPEEH